jgi:biopolymer transport protein ExbB/TolQ
MEEARKQAMMQRAVGSGAGQMNDLMSFNESADAQASKNKGTEDRTAKLEARRTQFANKINSINRAVMSSEVRSSHLKEPTSTEIKQTLKKLYSNLSSGKQSSLNLLGSIGETEDPADFDTIFDNGVAVLTAADYCQFRLQPLIAEYKARSPILSRRLGSFHLIMVILTALTTGLAMTSYRLWVPLLVSVGAAIATTLEWEQLQNRHRNVNQCLEELSDLYTWWESLSMVEKRMPKHKEQLVFNTENNNDAEISAFVKSAVRLGASRKGGDGNSNDADTVDEEDVATI